jgi:hypothetical protein
MEVSGHFHAPAALSSRKEPRYPLDRRLGGPQSRSGRDGENKNSNHCIFRQLNPGRPGCSVVTVLIDCNVIYEKSCSTGVNLVVLDS